MKFNSYKLAGIALGLAMVSSSGWSATTTTTLSVSGSVIGACSVSATALSFGLSIPSNITTNQDPSAATITTTCSLNTPYTITLGLGSGSGATFAARKLVSGLNTMVYSLYTDSGRVNVWGDGVTGGTSSVTGTGTGSGVSTSVYGRIPSGQTVAVASYADTVTVTVTY